MATGGMDTSRSYYPTLYMLNQKLNLGCGTTFVNSDNWINFDYAPTNATVQQADLLAPLRLESGSVAVVYTSHFLEHVPRSLVPALLAECFRVLRPGGVIRLVLPDLEEMCREYLFRREAGEHEKANFVVVEMIDQCVRLVPEGELGQIYQRYAADPVRYSQMIDYVRKRNGEDLYPKGRRYINADQLTEESTHCKDWYSKFFNRLIWRVRAYIARTWLTWSLQCLPPAFRQQNVSLASVGERHYWLWDLHQISQVLRSVGFQQIERCQFNTSCIADFPFYPLDTDDEGQPRKGVESMFVEAIKPS